MNDQADRGSVPPELVVCSESRRRLEVPVWLLYMVLADDKVPPLKGECSCEMLGADLPRDAIENEGRDFLLLESFVELESVLLIDVLSLPVLLALRIFGAAPPNPTSRLVPD